MKSSWLCRLTPLLCFLTAWGQQVDPKGDEERPVFLLHVFFSLLPLCVLSFSSWYSISTVFIWRVQDTKNAGIRISVNGATTVPR